MVQAAGLRFSRLTAANTVFFECDIQKKLANHIHHYATMAHNGKRLTQISQTLKIPIISTAQKNFGDVDERITEVHHDLRQCFIDKTKFSMLEPRVESVFRAMERENVVLYGCEAHICVKHTCLDLLEQGYKVHLVVDAISSMQI